MVYSPEVAGKTSVKAINRYRWGLVWRVLLLVLLLGATVFSLAQSNYWLLSIWFGAGAIVMVVSLVRYTEHNHRALLSFLTAIEQKEYTQVHLQVKKAASNLFIAQSLGRIQKAFQQLRNEKAANYLLLQTVLEQVATGLICFNKQGEILLVNRAALDMLDRPHFSHLNTIKNTEPLLYTQLLELQPGQSVLVKRLFKNELQPLALSASTIVIDQIDYLLVTLQDIRAELEVQELDSWQKLIKVLRHEIMNSAIPISTLADVTLGLIQNEQGTTLPVTQLAQEQFQDVATSLQTIHKRSQGLVAFVEAYRSLVSLPEPDWQLLDAAILLASVRQLLLPQAKQKDIVLHLSNYNGTVMLRGDRSMLEQVLINLVTNAIEALEQGNTGNGQITLGAQQHEKGIVLWVKDNGPGIAADMQEQVMVPFYSTKANGNGIGLSLSRQIMQLHKGKLILQSAPGHGTVISLQF